MRAAIVMLLASVAIPIAFFSPFWGLVSYCLLSYMRPQDMAWGVGHISFGFYVTIALFAGLFLRLKLAVFRASPVTFLMLALWLWVGFSVFTAIQRPLALEGFSHISKIFVICLVTTALCVDKNRLRWVLVAIAGGLAFHGVKMGFYGLVHGGVQLREGIGGMMSGNNENAIALGVALPFCVYFALDEERRWRRMSWWIAAGGTALAILWTYSRGGFLGMMASFAVIVWRTRYRTVTVCFLVPLAVVLFFSFAPDAYVERVSSIGDASQTDLSAIRRIEAWRIAAHITGENPLLGIGPRNFPDEFRRFPHPYDLPRMEIHNTYLELSSSSGIPALALYGLLILAGMRACSRVVRDALQRADRRLRWFIGTGRALQAAMIGFLVSSTFGSLMHFDLMYHLCALCACVPVAYAHELARLAAIDADAAQVEEDAGDAYASVVAGLAAPPVPAATPEPAVPGTPARDESMGVDGPPPDASEHLQVEHRAPPARPWFEARNDAPLAEPRRARALEAQPDTAQTAARPAEQRTTGTIRTTRKLRREECDVESDESATYVSADDGSDGPVSVDEARDGSATFLGILDESGDDRAPGATPPPGPALDEQGLSAFDARVLGRPRLRERADRGDSLSD